MDLRRLSQISAAFPVLSRRKADPMADNTAPRAEEAPNGSAFLLPGKMQAGAGEFKEEILEACTDRRKRVLNGARELPEPVLGGSIVPKCGEFRLGASHNRVEHGVSPFPHVEELPVEPDRFRSLSKGGLNLSSCQDRSRQEGHLEG